jgi:hypothetical protein
MANTPRSSESAIYLVVPTWWSSVMVWQTRWSIWRIDQNRKAIARHRKSLQVYAERAKRWL